MKVLFQFVMAIAMTLGSMAFAEGLVGKSGPSFVAKNQDGKEFKLESRKGKGYTVLFFYPKAGTPGCTKQACAFRDSIKVIRNEGAEVYGISADNVDDQKKFHEQHKMTFDLISDSDGKIIKAYDVKMPVLSMAKRQTFILDGDLAVRKHFENVDPALDAKNVAAAIADLKKEDAAKTAKK
jgi:peroxiredoxin Q/BCP